MFKKIVVYFTVTIILISTSFFTGAITTKHRLMEQHRLELELARERAAVLTDTLSRAREEVGAIGESLSRQRNSVAELRDLLTEVRRRYEKMEELLFSVRWDDSDVRNIDSGVDSADEGKISDQ